MQKLLNDRIQTLDCIQSYIGTFFSKEYVLRKVLNLTDAQIKEMRDQISKELETDPMDGGVDYQMMVMVSHVIHRMVMVVLFRQNRCQTMKNQNKMVIQMIPKIR